MADIHEVVVIGSGPAGYTAALYLARARLAPILFAGDVWGGQLMNTTAVENYPGFPKGIVGPDLMQNMREQASRFGAEIKDMNVTWVDFKKQPFLICI
jgi:thioredoxin reductase (NADPH)